MARTSWDQWSALALVVDKGGFAAAAAALHKSQSAVSYGVSRLQESLDLRLLAVSGRKAVLTPHGKVLLERARPLLRDLDTLEALARALKQGWEPELKLVVDAAYPRERLLCIMAELQRACPHTELQVSDAVLSGAEEAILENRADVVVTTRLPPHFLGELLADIDFVAVAAPRHPLFEFARTLSLDDLVRHVQVVVRDSGTHGSRDDGWLGSERRCTVNSLEASLATVKAGLGYAWLPEHVIGEPVRQGLLRKLPLAMGGTRIVPLNLVLVRPQTAGPAARAAVELFLRHRAHH
jgi:DNA-binding transcriptional LysR family regulator